MSELDIMAKRLKEALYDKQMRAVDLSEKTGISRASISQYMNKACSISPKSAELIGKALEVNPRWLMGLSDDKTAIETTWVDHKKQVTLLPESGGMLRSLEGTRMTYVENAIKQIANTIPEKTNKGKLTTEEQMFLLAYRNASSDTRMKAFEILMNGET